MERNTRKSGKYLIKVGSRANRYRVGAALAGMDANLILASASTHSVQAVREAVRLESLHRIANPDVYGATFDPPTAPAAPVLPPPAPPRSIDDTPVAYPDGNAPSDLLGVPPEDARNAHGDEASPRTTGAISPASLEAILATQCDASEAGTDRASQPNGRHNSSGGAPETMGR
jgi:hypothetical protein